MKFTTLHVHMSGGFKEPLAMSYSNRCPVSATYIEASNACSHCRTRMQDGNLSSADRMLKLEEESKVALTHIVFHCENL